MLEAKLVTKSHPEHQTIVKLSETVSVGGTELLIIGGPVPSKVLHKWKQSPANYPPHPCKLCEAESTNPALLPILSKGWELRDWKF